MVMSPLKKRRFIGICTNVVLVVMLAALAMITYGGGRTSFVFAEKEKAPYYKGCADRNEVSLMINVYWGTEFLPSMLDTLKKYGAKCTFFVGGCWADDNNELLLRIVDEGHELGNHGYFHKEHKDLSLEGNIQEIKPTNVLIKAITGVEMKLFAPPSGSYNNTTLKACTQLDMKVIMWSRDTIDWRDKDTDLVFTRATDKIGCGDMILMHPTAHTAKALPRILEYYKSKELHAVTVSQIISTEII